MPTAEELIVAIRSEGVSETQGDLEGVEQSMEETADSAGDAADDLEGFSERFQGAMNAAVAALAIGAAGLLTQVPVLGELFAGLAAIVAALGFQVDQLARSLGAGGLTAAMFELSNAIFEAEGAWGDFIGVVTTVASVAAIAAAAALKFGVTWATVSSAAGTAASALGTVAAVIAGIVGGITAATAALAIAIAAIVAFAAAYLTNWRGTRDKTDAILSDIASIVTSAFNDFVSNSLQKLESWKDTIAAVLTLAGAAFMSWAEGLVSDARAWGTNLIESFIDGIKAALDRLKDWLGDLRDVGAKVGINVPSVGNLGGGGGGGGGGGPTGRPAPSGGGGGDTFLDGRSVSESTGRYREDPSRRRGL
jgi:hypothetical protein